MTLKKPILSALLISAGFFVTQSAFAASATTRVEPRKPVKAFAPAAKGQTNIELVVKNIRPGRGNIIVELFDTAERYESGNPIGRTILQDTGLKAVANFENLESSYYAFKVFQDENKNGQLDKSQERYILQGRSVNNIRAENWDDAKIKFPHGHIYRTSTFQDPEQVKESDEDETLMQGVVRTYRLFANN